VPDEINAAHILEENRQTQTLSHPRKTPVFQLAVAFDEGDFAGVEKKMQAVISSEKMPDVLFPRDCNIKPALLV